MTVKFVGVFAALVLVAAGAAPAQDFEIPPEAVLGAMSADEKAAMERQMTTDALAWPLTELSEEMIQPDIMDELSPGRTGAIAGADGLHQATGIALIFDLDNGRGLVRFEDFEIVRAPGLHVFLSRSRNPLAAGLGVDFLDLGPLKAERGNHNYQFIGAWRDYLSVVIASQPFGVIVAVARLQ